MNLSKSIDKYIQEFEKKAEEYREKYQESGSPSQLRTCEKYDDLVEICIAAKKQEEEDTERMRRLRNGAAYIDSVEEAASSARFKTYSLNELLEHLNKLLNAVG